MPRGMNTMTIEVGLSIDKYEVAIAALNGAVSVMVAAGLEEREITALLLQAANSENVILEETNPSELEDNGDGRFVSVYDIEDDFEETATYKALSRLSKRADALDHQENDLACEKLEKLIEDALPHMKDAADWYRSACNKSGIKFEINRQSWLETASDAELDAEEDYLFFDNSRGSQTFSTWILTGYARSAARLGRAPQLKRLLEGIIEHGIVIEPAIFEEMTEGFKDASFKTAIQSQVEALESGFEMPQAEFIRTLSTVSDNGVSEHLLSAWIESFEEAGLLERYKRSNRWQIRRL